jgi:molybdopterin-synthase adenylyltransferase
MTPKAEAVLHAPNSIGSGFSREELERYSRQLRLEGFDGEAAQYRLKCSTVVISRSGGVGGTVAHLLARAGIGRLVLVHGGRVTREVLNRMHLAFTSDLDRPYTEVFVEKLRDINPYVELVSVPENMNSNNAASIIAQGDVIADGAPLFEERYAMNYEAVRQKKPLVSGAMYDLEGHATTIVPGETPCLSCIYPSKPDYWNTIEVFPAIGSISTLVGAVMAMEVIKLLTGMGDTLKGRLWRFDLRSNQARHFKINRRDDCPICGQAARKASA